MLIRVWPICWQIPALTILMICGSNCAADPKTFDPRDPNSPLHLVRTIELPDVKGRIDHMALDAERGHLFVAEYGNGRVDEVDLASGRIDGRIAGLHEPQGVAWLPKQGEIAVASGDGSVSFYRATDQRKVGSVRLGDDADNVRIDNRTGDLVVGFGSGALAVINPSTHRLVRQLNLPAHPEAFEIIGSRVFVNVPDAHQIVLGDLDQARVVTTIKTGRFGGNYPMAADPSGLRFASAYRSPSTLAVMDARSLAATFSVPVCGDADDLYFYSGRIVVMCGEGAIQLVDEGTQHKSVRVGTVRGARTGLLDRERNRLFVAVPARQSPAAIWELSFR